jgi:hypothetical protein
MYTITPMYHMYKDRHMEKFRRVIRHIKLISMNRRLFWIHLKVEKPGENRKKPTTFFNPETEPNPDQKPTFEQKTETDPDRLLKVNPAGL